MEFKSQVKNIVYKSQVKEIVLNHQLCPVWKTIVHLITERDLKENRLKSWMVSTLLCCCLAEDWITEGSFYSDKETFVILLLCFFVTKLNY